MTRRVQGGMTILHLPVSPAMPRYAAGQPTRQLIVFVLFFVLEICLCHVGAQTACGSSLLEWVPPSPTFVQSSASSKSFSFSGTTQAYTVPTDVWFIQVDACGAASSSPGGLGGFVSSVIAVVPGHTLYVYIGGMGSWSCKSPSSDCCHRNEKYPFCILCNSAVGYNGGGIGTEFTVNSFFLEKVAYGGGSTDIRTEDGGIDGSKNPHSRIVVAGGGGGGARVVGSSPSDDSQCNTLFAAGAGGGLVGGISQNASSLGENTTSIYGAGGSQTTGGKEGNVYDTSCETSYPYCSIGTAGSLWHGGTGGGNDYCIAGGGGGGYYGGAGGSYYENDAGVGGGGSSYVIPSVKPDFLTQFNVNTQGDPRCSSNGALYITPVASIDSQRYPFSGDRQTYKVPAGITVLQVEMCGSQGGAGGRGGFVSAFIPATSGATLFVYVGGVDGFNGGGAGNGDEGFNGGGSTDIRAMDGGFNGSQNLHSRIVVAGGGGGGGSKNYGGAGGGPVGQSATDSALILDGQGGSQSAGGKGDSSDECQQGSSGSLWLGGSCLQFNGGGGGYYGGGAGLTGGGGGSSYFSPSATVVENVQGDMRCQGSGYAYIVPVASMPPSPGPTHVPSLPPSARPTLSPSLLPTSPSARPTQLPTSKPTTRPTFIPTYAPTRVPTESAYYAKTISVVANVTVDTQSEIQLKPVFFDNLGTKYAYYLSVSFAATGWANGGAYAFVDVHNIKKSFKCIPGNTCDSLGGPDMYLCAEASNILIKPREISSFGGSLSVTTVIMNANLIASASVCETGGNDSFSDGYKIYAEFSVSGSHGMPTPLPTAEPTLAPSPAIPLLDLTLSQQEASLSTVITSSGALFYAIAAVATCYAVLALLLAQIKQGHSRVYAMGLFSSIVTMALVGASFASEMFLLDAMLNTAGCTVLGLLMLLGRLLHLPASYYILAQAFGQIVKTGRSVERSRGPETAANSNSASAPRALPVDSVRLGPDVILPLNLLHDHDLMLANSKLFGALAFLCASDCTAVRFFPWLSSPFCRKADGYPSGRVFLICVCTKLLQSLVTVSCQVSYFALVNAAVSTDTPQARQLLAFLIINMVTTVLLVVINAFEFAVQRVVLLSGVLSTFPDGGTSSMAHKGGMEPPPLHQPTRKLASIAPTILQRLSHLTGGAAKDEIPRPVAAAEAVRNPLSGIQVKTHNSRTKASGRGGRQDQDQDQAGDVEMA